MKKSLCLFAMVLSLVSASLASAQVFTPVLHFKWSDNSSDELGFLIERRLQTILTFTEIATVPANVLTYDDTAITADTIYCYRVRSYKMQMVNSVMQRQYSTAYSNVVCASSAAAPGSPTNLMMEAQTQAAATGRNLENAYTYLERARKNASTRMSSIASARAQVIAAQETLRLVTTKMARAQQGLAVRR